MEYIFLYILYHSMMLHHIEIHEPKTVLTPHCIPLNIIRILNSRCINVIEV